MRGAAPSPRVARLPASPRLAPPLAVGAAAWALLLLVEGSPLAWALDHDLLALSAVPLAAAVPAYAAGWTLMVAAMMLPAALALARPARPLRWVPGYLAAWCAAGFAFAGLDLALHAVLPADGRVARALPAAAVGLACAWLAAVAAAPASLGHGGAAGGGWLHGLRCLFACWPVMLALQAAAPGDLGAMALATAASSASRLARPVVRAGRPSRARGTSA